MARSLYNEYYTTENLFGEAYKELVDFFENYKDKGHVLDLGCGQGRDSIALARLGYTITAVDNSSLGIKQMLTVAQKEKLPINGIVDDIYTFSIADEYDIILLDSMFHFYKKDRAKEIAFIERLMLELKPGGIICFCINAVGNKVKILKDIFLNSTIKFDTIHDSNFAHSFIYEGKPSLTKYKMLIVKKEASI